MMNDLCALTGAEFPLFAFSHCRDVVAAVSRAGGFGVLGGSSFTPEDLEKELSWIVDQVNGKPFGVDVLIPENAPRGDTRQSPAELAARIPDRHRNFSIEVLAKHGIELAPANAVDVAPPRTTPEAGEALLEVAFRFPIRLIANALGIAPPRMIELGRKHGVPVAALVGSKEHALRQLAAGVDILIAQGTEAGGHCGEVATLVLVPEVVRAIARVRKVPVLAAGGIMTGGQMAGCMAMGAQGAWTGSVWLATTEAETSQVFRDRMIEASSRNTVRSRARTGKPARQLRSAWHDAWEGPASPGTLSMPLMGAISVPAFDRIDRAAAAGHEGARELVSYFVGQGVGLVDSVRSAGAVVQSFKEEFAESVLALCDALATAT
jgi:NAD(P)H-dependent flavin oxidoreductase YrpB (nitropropane dioxygenase family)